MAQRLRPDSTFASSQWRRTSWFHVSETVPNDQTRTYSRRGEVGAYWTIGFTNPLGTPREGTSTINFRVGRSRERFALNGPGQNPRYQLSLYEGNTLIAQDVERVAEPLPDPGESPWWGYFWFLRPRFETLSWVVDTSAITDWTNIRLRIDIIGFDNPTEAEASLTVSWIEMVVPDDAETPLSEDIVTGAPQVGRSVLLSGNALTENWLLFSGDMQNGLDALLLSGDQQTGADYLLLADDGVVDLVGDDITAYVFVDRGTLWLIPDDITTGAPLLSMPALDDGTINGSEIITGAPLLDLGVLGQQQSIIGDEISATPVLDPGALTQLHDLAGDPIDGVSPELASPLLRELHPLLGNEISTTPVLDSAALHELHNLLGDPVVASVVIDLGVLTQLHDLSGEPITGGEPTLSTSLLKEIHNLLGDPISASVLIEGGVLTQRHNLAGERIVAGMPAIADGLIGQNHVLTGYDIVVQPVTVDKSELLQVHALTGNEITLGVPDLTAGVLVFRWLLFGDDIVTGRPLIDRGLLEQDHRLLGDPVEGRHPRLEEGTIAPQPTPPREVVCAGTGPREAVIDLCSREAICVGRGEREVVCGKELRLVYAQ